MKDAIKLGNLLQGSSKGPMLDACCVENNGDAADSAATESG